MSALTNDQVRGASEWAAEHAGERCWLIIGLRIASAEAMVDELVAKVKAQETTIDDLERRLAEATKGMPA